MMVKISSSDFLKLHPETNGIDGFHLMYHVQKCLDQPNYGLWSDYFSNHLILQHIFPIED